MRSSSVRRLRREDRRALAAKLRVEDADVDSILRLIETRLELTRSAFAEPERET